MEEKIKPEGRVVFTSWTNIEAKTGEGQIVSLSCRPDEIDEVKEFFRSKVCNVMSPETRKAIFTSIPDMTYTSIVMPEEADTLKCWK